MPLTEAAGSMARFSESVMPDLPGAEQVEQAALRQVVGAGRVAEGRADAAVGLGDQVLVGEVLVGLVAPLAPHAGVEHLGERLGQPVGERLDHDRRVVVVVALVGARELLDADARGHREGAHVVEQAGLARRHEVGERSSWLLSSAFTRCWRSIGKRTSSAERPASV